MELDDRVERAEGCRLCHGGGMALGRDVLTEQDYPPLQIFAERIRLETVKELGHLGFGHIGGSMSIAETLAVLYGWELQHDPDDPDWPGRDMLVLSKGHAGPALYAALALRGFFPKSELETLNQPHTRLPSHCDRKLTPGVDMTTGSLGQGLSAALGMALAFQMDSRRRNVYCIIGDGECDEGQIWEAALLAGAKKADRLTLFVDCNGRQLDGATKDVLDLGDVAAKFASFGWHVQEVNGHDIGSIWTALNNIHMISGRPHAVILKTVKGKGCSFAEGKPNNHSMNISQDMVDEAVKEIQERISDLVRGPKNRTFKGV